MDNDLIGILEAVIIKDSINLFMARLAVQHKGHPDFEATMQFCGTIYKKYAKIAAQRITCLLYTSPSPRDRTRSRMPSSA